MSETCSWCGGKTTGKTTRDGDKVLHHTVFECAESLKTQRSDAQYQVRVLTFLLVKRRVMEPKHSREDHECQECDMLAEMKRGIVTAI